MAGGADKLKNMASYARNIERAHSLHVWRTTLKTVQTMKTKFRPKPRNPSTAARLSRHAAVNDRRRRLSLWQFYQATGESETEQRVVETVLTEPSSR